METTIIRSHSSTATSRPMANTDIPVPDSSAHTGQQEPTIEVLPPDPEPGLPVIEAIERGLATHSTTKDDFASGLLASYTRQLGNEAVILRADNARLQRALDDQRDVLESERRCNAVLAERLESDRGNRHLQNVGITVGTSMASAGIFGDFTASPGGLSLSLIVGGIALALVSWLRPRRANSATRKGNGS